MASNQLFQQSEVVRKKAFPLWMTADFGVLSDFIEKGEVQRVGERDYRIPFQQTFGGIAGHYDPQGGDMGRGSSPTGNVLLQSFYSFRLNFEFDEMQIAATENKDVAIQNPFTKCVAEGMKEMNNIWDQVIHGSGTAFLAQATAFSNTSGATVYTMSNVFGVQLLRRGQLYNVYDSTGNTLKASNVLAVQINTQARTLTTNIIIPNAAATDQISFVGVAGAQPAGPRGLGYWLNTAISGITAGVDRSLEYQIIPKSVDGTNGFTVETVMALYHRILSDRGMVPNLLGICNVAQQAYAYSQMVAIQMPLIEGEKANVFDRLPKLKGKKFFMWGDIPWWIDIRCDSTKAFAIVPSDWGKAVLSPDGFYETPGKSGPDARFIQLMGTSGGPQASVWFCFVRNQDLYCFNPGEQGVITNLPLGSLYT